MKNIRIRYTDSVPDVVEQTKERLLGILPTAEAMRISAMKNDKSASDSLLCYILLYDILKCDFGITTSPELYRNEHGKPFLKGIPLYFSYSHCRTGIACAVCESELGVDYQDVRPYSPKVADRVCSMNELLALSSVGDIVRPQLFTQMWAQKESISKLTGKGLAAKFNTIDTLSPQFCVHTAEPDNNSVIAAACVEQFELELFRADIYGILAAYGADFL